jgi:hypothetical protein
MRDRRAPAAVSPSRPGLPEMTRAAALPGRRGTPGGLNLPEVTRSADRASAERRASPRGCRDFAKSPLPDSNRRPLPYHRAPRDFRVRCCPEVFCEVPAKQHALQIGHDWSVPGWTRWKGVSDPVRTQSHELFVGRPIAVRLTKSSTSCSSSNARPNSERATFSAANVSAAFDDAIARAACIDPWAARDELENAVRARSLALSRASSSLGGDAAMAYASPPPVSDASQSSRSPGLSECTLISSTVARLANSLERAPFLRPSTIPCVGSSPYRGWLSRGSR